MAETIKSAKELCRIFMQHRIPVFLMGPPGIGKSEMWKQLADEEGIGFSDQRLPQMDPVDLRGLPKHEGEYTKWARPDFWPVVERDGERGIILFDELSDCGRAMQSAAYQIILDGCAGPHVIPPGWYRCAAGNSRTHKAGAQALSSALANRFAWVDVEADPECFIEHGTKVGFHYLVLGFIRFRPALLHSMEGADLRAFATPRAWEKVSRICEVNDTGLRFRLIRACVGDGAAGEFEAYMRTIDLPDLEEILAAPSKCRIPKEPSSRYALVSMLSQFADCKNFEKICAYIRRPELGRDFEIACVLDATKRDASLTETPAFINFANRNSDLVL